MIQGTLHVYDKQTSEERQKLKPFAAFTTLKALRVTIKTICEIAENLFAAKRPYVLTGRLNQDCLEVR